MAVFFTCVGWLIVFFISDRTSRRNEIKADINKISDFLTLIKSNYTKYYSEKDEIIMLSHESDLASKISQIEKISRSISYRTDLKEEVLSSEILAELRLKSLLEGELSIAALYESCDQLEELLMDFFEERYHRALFPKYRVEIFAFLIFVIPLIAAVFEIKNP